MAKRIYECDIRKDDTLAYDAENHLTAVSGDATASFGYNGDGQRITSTEGGVTTAYIGNYFEWNVATQTKKTYYYAGATRIAMREGSGDTVFAGAGPQWILDDHQPET